MIRTKCDKQNKKIFNQIKIFINVSSRNLDHKKARTNAILELMKSKKHKETEFTILNSEFLLIIYDIYILKFNIIYFIITKLSLIAQNF